MAEDSQMRPGTNIELGWVLGISMEQSMPSKHQHKPTQLHVASTNLLVVAPQWWNTRKVASKLTTSSCSNAAVGEKVARRRIEPTNLHRRHGRRGRARSTAFTAREHLPIYHHLSIYYPSIYHLSRQRSSVGSLSPFPTRRDQSARWSGAWATGHC